MLYTKQVEIAAPSAHVWSVLADLGRWPSWTPTVTALDVLDDAAPGLHEGTRVRITQPGMSPAVYTVTEVDEGHRFRWEARRPGIRQHADHEVEAVGPRHSRVTLGFGMDGPIGRLVSPIARSTVQRMVDSEADALRGRAENDPAGRGR